MIARKADKTLEEKLVSPCVQICVRDKNEDVCLGCGRTSLEIKDWATYSRENKVAILNELEGRMDALNEKRRRARRGRQRNA